MAPTDDTKERIMEAAHDVFLRRGTAGARMQEIADVADVNKALLHYHFDDKATLSEAVFLRAARGFLPRVLEVLRSGSPVEEKVRRVVQIELDHLLEHPFVPGYFLTEIHSRPERARSLMSAVAGEPAGEFVPEVVETLDRQLRDGASEGRLRAVEPEQFVVNLIALCIFPFAAAPMLRPMFGWDDADFRAFIERRKELLPELFLAGLRP